MNFSINSFKFVPSFSANAVRQPGYNRRPYYNYQNTGVDTFELRRPKPEYSKLVKLQRDIDSKMEAEDYDGVLKSFGMDVSLNDNGEKVLSSFHQPSSKYSFADLGVDENELLKDIVGIDGDFVISNSKVSELPNLKYVRGNVDMTARKDVSMPNLQSVGGSVRAPHTDNLDLHSLAVINGHANFADSYGVDLSSLVKVTDTATFNDSEEVNLSSLLYTGDDTDFSFSSGVIMPKLMEVAGNLEAREADINDLSSVRFIKGNLDVRDSSVEKLAVGLMIDGDIHAENSNIQHMRTGSVGGSVYIKGTEMTPSDFIYQHVHGHVFAE